MNTDLPTTMATVEISTPGGPEVLRLTRRPTPKPGPGEVLIRVFAAGVNRPDVMQRQGHYPPPPGASDIPVQYPLARRSLSNLKLAVYLLKGDRRRTATLIFVRHSAWFSEE